MDEKKKKIEEINKIYQNLISSEEENQKQKLTELYKSIHEPLSSAEKQKQEQIELLKKSFSGAKSSISDILVSEIPNSNSYIKRYFDMAEDIDDKDLLHVTKDLLSFTENINKDKFKYDMDQLNKIEPIHEFKHQRLLDYPNYGKIITDSLVLVVNHLEDNNSLLKEQIENNNLASKNIIDENKKTADEQIQLLKEQIDKSDASFEKQLEDSRKSMTLTRKSMKWTIGIAVVSIAIAIGSTIWSVNKTEEIYDKENNSSDIQHNELKEILENNSNKNLIFEDKQLKVLNQILEAIKENETIKDKKIVK